MKKVVISADSAADLPKDIAQKYGIKIMPMHVNTGGKTLREGIDVFGRDIFDCVEKTGLIPKTSAVAPGEYMDFFAEAVKKGYAVVHLSFCSGLSSTCRNAVIASARMGDVFVLDTKNLGGGIGLLAIKACQMRDSGLSAEEIFTRLRAMVDRVKVSYLLDSIEYLKISGRCSAAAVFGANLLSIKPCAGMVDGKIEILKKYKGKIKAVRLQYVSEQLEKYSDIDYSTVFVYHSGVDADEIAVITEMLRSAGFSEIIVGETGCMISLHSARGALGVHFILKGNQE